MTATNNIPASSLNQAFPGYGQMNELGASWRIKFYDVDGTPLSMISFEVIDFGAISFKEIFQNVKTILSTPIYSAALERLLGVDQNIVDLPIQEASQATIAILDALFFWESRVEVVNINFASDVISGRLICNLQLNIRNVIYGTDTPYDRNNAFGVVPPTQEVNMIPGPPGPPGPQGIRGTAWFLGTTDPTFVPSAPPPIGAPQQNDIYMNTATGDIFQFDVSPGGSTLGVGTWRKAK
jgi:phage baseplate assembly protein W